jgi:hypothetical protein
MINTLLIILSILPTLCTVESNNDPLSVGDYGDAIGILQIHKICVDDVNRVYNTTYTHEDMFDEELSKEVFILYLTYGAVVYKNKFNRYPNEEELVRMWNGGIYNGYKIKSTKIYYKKYLKINYE